MADIDDIGIKNKKIGWYRHWYWDFKPFIPTYNACKKCPRKMLSRVSWL